MLKQIHSRNEHNQAVLLFPCFAVVVFFGGRERTRLRVSVCVTAIETSSQRAPFLREGTSCPSWGGGVLPFIYFLFFLRKRRYSLLIFHRLPFAGLRYFVNLPENEWAKPFYDHMKSTKVLLPFYRILKNRELPFPALSFENNKSEQKLEIMTTKDLETQNVRILFFFWSRIQTFSPTSIKCFIQTNAKKFFQDLDKFLPPPPCK